MVKREMCSATEKANDTQVRLGYTGSPWDSINLGIGLAEMIGGAALTVFGAGGTVLSGGTASPVSIPAAGLGVVAAGVGVVTVHSALQNMFAIQVSHSSSNSSQDDKNGKSGNKSQQGNSGSSNKPNGNTGTNNVVGGNKSDVLDDILDDAKPGRVTKGKTKQYVKPGSYEQAVEDFDALGASNTKEINTTFGQGKTGTLSDGRTVTVRPGSKEGRPTLEIREPNRRGIEIRYGE